MYAPVNLALDHLDATQTRLSAMIDSMKKSGASAEQIAKAQELVDAGTALEAKLSAGFKNDEDSVNRPGALREAIQGLLFGVFGSQGPPISTHYGLEAKVRAQYLAVMADYRTWAASADAMK
jgi:hypothetical protein